MVFFMVMATTVWATPKLINYQGKLTKNGVTVTNTALLMTFQIFTEEVDNGENSIWYESQNVNVEDGFYSVKLGSENTLDSTLFNESSDVDYWLEVSINDETLSPSVTDLCTFCHES